MEWEKAQRRYHSQRTVSPFVLWVQDLDAPHMKKDFYTDLDKSVLFKQDYISKRPGHNRGSTVGLTLFDVDAGEDVDMGGMFDYFGQRSHWDCKEHTREQRANRVLLREVMMTHEFRSISTE